MTTAILKAKSMVRKAREVADIVADNKTVFKLIDTIEFLVLMTLPFAIPVFIMIMSYKGY